MYKELQCKVVHMAEVMKNSGYTYDTICCIKRGAFGYVEYLQMFGLLPSEETRDQYLDWLESSFIENRSYYLATRKRAVNRFLMFMETGNCNSRNPIKRHQFYGAFSREMNDFIEHLHGQFMANVTISEYHRRLRQFNDYLNKNNYSEITASSVIGFFTEFAKENTSPYAFYACSTYIQKFLGFCFEYKYLTEDISSCVPRGRYKRCQTLPSVYSDEEIKKILNSVDRNSAIGKRDYAMILLLTCIGLRSSDVVNLTFNDIDWDNSVINLRMSKTGKEIQLPLFPDLGNAIIDWIRNGRRETKLPYIFQPIKGAITPLSSSALYSAVNKHFRKAGVNITHRRHGTHSLRHSLATRLLKQGEPLTVISEALGHNDTQVTTVYTSIDINALRACALPVPLLRSRAYSEV